MNKDKKRRLISTIVTATVHLVLLLVLMFVTLTLAEPADEEYGVPVLLGNVDDAAGVDLNGLPEETQEANLPDEADLNDETNEMPEAEEVDEPTPPPTPQMTQQHEPSIAAEEAAKKREEEMRKKAAEEAAAKKAAEEARRKAEEEARRKAEEEAARRAAINSRVSGKFGKTGNDTGNTQGEGNQGSPDGNSNTGQVSGVGGVGNAQVGTRKALHLEKPEYSDPTSAGTIVVSIIVNAAGIVESANIASGTTTTSRTLRSSAIAAARESTFTSGSANESGTITYIFKQR